MEQADISRTNIEYLRGVLASCHAERIKKERELESLLGDLKRLCMELGEDDCEAAASAHPSLRSCNAMMASLGGGGAGLTPMQDSARGPNPEGMEISLCDETFRGLELKIDELRHLRLGIAPVPALLFAPTATLPESSAIWSTSNLNWAGGGALCRNRS